MTLRARITAWFAVAALLPILVAALITRQVLADKYRDEYQANRQAAEQVVRGEIDRLRTQASAAVTSLSGPDHPFVAGILREIDKGGEALDAGTLRRIREQGGPVMRGLSLDVMVITTSQDVVLVSPHLAATDEVDEVPSRRAQALRGKAAFAFETVVAGPSLARALVVESAQVSRDGAHRVHVLAGRRVGTDLFAAVVRPDRIAARVVDAAGATVLAAGQHDWTVRDHRLRIALPGHDDHAVAWVEVAVSDGGLSQLLRRVTVISVGLATLALLVTVLAGVYLSQRMTRDLDALVAGAAAAARGDLGHRVKTRADDEIGEVALAFNRMMDDLHAAKERLVVAERIAAWQEIARRLAHEIKNPLTPIQMAMDTLRKTWRKKHPSFDEILEESTSTVLQEADRLKCIVTEFSDFARMPKPDFAHCDLGEVVASTLALYQGSSQLQVDVEPGLPALELDRGQISQVVLNLVENARDAIAGRGVEGQVRVGVHRADSGDRLILAVEDNGSGISQDIRDKLFVPYFTTKEGRGGTGLGLAIVQRVVVDHGGRIVVSSSRLGGARFTVELPLQR
jgi:signal transduction histidine kinase